MTSCPSCAEVNPDRARFCFACGTRLPSPEPAPDARKTVTLVFCDLVGSTALAERMDPEAVREIVTRYYDEMRGILIRHGGTIEKFVGDAVMAAFGVPVVHEDDALRAVRAADEMQKAMTSMSERIERRAGVGLEARIGVNTGEVMAGDASEGQGFVSGDAVNLAARLEQAAGPGTILISATTLELVRDAVEVEPVSPLDLKGKEKPVEAWRLVAVRAGRAGVARRLDSPLVGRRDELSALRRSFTLARAERLARMVTILGPAGVGKSRTTAEFLGSAQDEALILRGHCLAYGESTFAPIAEALQEVAGITADDSAGAARAKLRRLIGGLEDEDLVAERLEQAVGLTATTSDAQEAFWAVRRTLEQFSRDAPVIAVFDDIHWAQPTFLDMLEYLGGWIDDAPILIVCTARPDLLESRPDWAQALSGAETLVLQPLPALDSRLLIDNFLGATELPDHLYSAVTEAAEGNPLYIEEILRKLVEEETLRKRGETWHLEEPLTERSLPATIQALISARLDRLEPSERGAIQRAGVIGRVFWWGSVRDLSPEDKQPQVGSYLQALTRKGLIAPEASSFVGEDAFQFSHILIRDSVYEGIAKKLRADLHERFAAWLERRVGDRVREYEEALGYHLEQTYLLRSELDPFATELEEVGRRAAGWLASSGRRALQRADMPAARDLLQRAVRLLDPNEPEAMTLAVELSEPLLEAGEFEEAEALLNSVAERADSGGESSIAWRARLQGSFVDLYANNPEGWKDNALALADEAVRTFTDSGDDLGLSQAYQLIAQAHWVETQFRATEGVLERALEHAERAGDERGKGVIQSALASTLFWGPTHVDEADVRCREIVKRASGNRLVEAKCLLLLGGLQALRGSFDEARHMAVRARATMEELGLSHAAATSRQISGTIEMLAGDPSAAEAEFRAGYNALEDLGDKGYLSGLAGFVARALIAQDRYEEADHFATVSESLSPSDDLAAKTDWGPPRAKLLAHEGKLAEAKALAAEVVAISARSDELKDHADALFDLAEICLTTGEEAEARRLLEEARRLYAAKGVIPTLASVDAALAALA